MDLLTLARVVIRRWYVVLVAAVLTVGSGIAVIMTAEAEYEANAAVMLTGRSSDDSASTDQVIDPGIIAEVAQGSSVRAGLDTNVPYTVDVGGDGEILRVTARDVSPEGLVETVEAVMDAIASEVQTRQHNAGIPQEDRATTEFLRMPDQPIAASDGSEFTASGSVQLVPASNGGGQPYPPNSYTLSVLQTRLFSEEALQTLTERGAEAVYTVDFNSRGAAPMMMISASGTADQDPIETMNLLIDLLREELTARQDEANVLDGNRTTIEELSVPTVAEVTSSNLLRPLVAVIGIGTITAFALAFVTEGVAQAIARRRAETEAALRRELLSKAVIGRDRDPSVDGRTTSPEESTTRTPEPWSREPYSAEPHEQPFIQGAPTASHRDTAVSTKFWRSNGKSAPGSEPIDDPTPAQTERAGEHGRSRAEGLRPDYDHVPVPGTDESNESAETVELRIPDEIHQPWPRHR